MPFVQSRFTPFYGYGNLDTAFYFALPTYILLKFTHTSIMKRIVYSSVILTFYTLFKCLYIKEYNEEAKEFYDYYLNTNKLV